MSELIETADIECLDKLCLEMQSFENEFILQLERLEKDIPEVYAGYAKCAKELMLTVLNLTDLKGAAALGAIIITEFISRGVKAYGAYKSAVKHNKQLIKILEAKRVVANANHERVKYLIPQIKKVHDKGEKVLCKIQSMEYDFNNVTAENANRMTNVILRVVNVYRKSSYFRSLADYLDNEYSAWKEGKQTSNCDFPDIYKTNVDILKKVGKSLPTLYILQKGVLHGNEYMLLADPQLSMMVLKNKWTSETKDGLNIGISSVIHENPTFSKYDDFYRKAKLHFFFSPRRVITVITILAILLIFYACYLFNSVDALKCYAIGGLIATIVVTMSIVLKKRLRKPHYRKGKKLLYEARQMMEIYCGRRYQNKFDYERKKVWAEVCGAFTSN